jgi:hypothetical protein
MGIGRTKSRDLPRTFRALFSSAAITIDESVMRVIVFAYFAAPPPTPNAARALIRWRQRAYSILLDLSEVPASASKELTSVRMWIPRGSAAGVRI